MIDLKKQITVFTPTYNRAYIDKKCFMLEWTATVRGSVTSVSVRLCNDLLTNVVLKMRSSTDHLNNLPINRFMTATTGGGIYIEGGYNYNFGASGVDAMSCVYFVI